MTEPHLDLDALADLLAAEGTEADEAHLSTCEGCADRLQELATAELEVATVLASLPAPPVPVGLAARLQAAIAAEPPVGTAAEPPVGTAAEPPVGTAAEPPPVAGSSVSTGAAPEGPENGARTAGATVTPFPDAGVRRPRRWLPVAAAVALVVSGGALGTTLLLTGGTGGDDAQTSLAGDAGGGAADPFGDLPRNETGTDYAADGTLAAALPALIGGSAGPVTAPLAATDESQESAAEPAPAADAPAAALTEQRAARVDPALDRLRTPEGLASCLAALLPPDEPDVRPLAVDYAAYQGQPALVVLLPAGGAGDKVDVFVVGAGCTVGADATLFFTRLDRP